MSKQANKQRLQAAQLSRQENADERVQRLYAGQGGPLVNWLLDEARIRGISIGRLADELGVTPGYIHHLRSRIRSPAAIGQEFADACGRFLGVPTVVVKLLAGRLLVRDFCPPRETEGEMVDRVFRRMLEDPTARQCLPADLAGIDGAARKALVLMYAEASGQDVFGLRELPTMLQYLQRAVVIHDENEGLAVRGHRDVA